jgi:hypothetical protein
MRGKTKTLADITKVAPTRVNIEGNITTVSVTPDCLVSYVDGALDVTTMDGRVIRFVGLTPEHAESLLSDLEYLVYGERERGPARS